MTTKLPQPDPPTYRFYLGAIGLGIGVGITWTDLLLGDYARRFITKPHAIMLLYGMVAFFFITQTWMLVRWNRRMKRDRAEMVKMMLDIPEWKRPEDFR